MVEVRGSVAKGFERVREAFVQGQANDRGGAQLCVYRKGEVVVDLWAGRDVVNDRPYAADTIAVLMSCTKAVTAVCVHMLAERGLLDLDAPVARYWPAFAANGKAGVTIAHVLTHSSGLFAFERASGIDAEAALDWSACTRALETMHPLWEPGSAYLYHFITYGYILGEVIRRVSGKPIAAFVDDEIATPLNLDLWIGLPEGEEHRVAPHIRSNAVMTDGGLRTMFAGLGLDVEAPVVAAMIYAFVSAEELIELLTKRKGRAAVIPAANGIASARALAKMYAATIGEVDGVRLLTKQTVDRARTPQTDRLDGAPPFLIRGGAPQRFGLGFELPRATVPMLGDGSFGHPGAGGRYGFAHPETGLAVAYVCNNLVWDGQTLDPRWTAWNAALRETASNA